MSLSVAQVTDGGLHRECFQYVAYRCVFVQDCQDFVGLFTTFPPARDARLIDILTELTRTAQSAAGKLKRVGEFSRATPHP
jgi:hypothetical protein